MIKNTKYKVRICLLNCWFLCEFGYIVGVSQTIYRAVPSYCMYKKA